MARLVDGFSVQQELVGGEARHERPEGVCLSHMDLSHPPKRPPGGIVAEKRSGAGARANSLFGSEGHGIRGALRSPNLHLLSKLLD